MDPTTTYRNYNNNVDTLPPQSPSFYNSTQQLRESDGILIANAATAANERRAVGQKTIMNCFRDRTPSYTRSNSHIARANGGLLPTKPQQGVVFPPPQREPQPRPRPIKLTLLKSSSSKDLTRLLELEPLAAVSSTSSSDLTKMTSSSSLSSSSTNCSNACLKHIKKLEQRIDDLEKVLSQQTNQHKDMTNQLEELTRKYDILTKEMLVTTAATDIQNKRKKSVNPRSKKENATATQTGAVVVQPSKLVAWMKLSNFWKQRPSIQTLKDQNIYNDEPCFDTEIEMVLKDEVHKTVPKIVVDCCQLVEDKYRKSTDTIEGIYRQCGDYNKMQALRFSIDSNDYNALKQPNVDIHTLAGLLKLFLREIKSPLISANEAKTFIGKPNQWLLSDLPTKLEILRRLIRSLPEVNRDTMEYLFAHFNKLTKVPLQHISAETLAISITPSVFHTVQQGARMQDIHALLKESEILADCVKIMIEYHQKIFDSSQILPNSSNASPIPFPRSYLNHQQILN